MEKNFFFAPLTSGLGATRRAAVLLLVMLLTMAQTAGAQDAISGLTYNSTDGYYEISDAQDLVDLATYVNGGNNASGKTFKQTADIDMQGVTFTPIGNKEDTYVFYGTYDGDGYFIKNISYSNTGLHALSGMFGQVNGTVRNVNLKDCNFTGKMAGGIAGETDGSALIQNCNVLGGTITGTGNANTGHFGGIVGYFYKGTVDGCFTTTTYSGGGFTKGPVVGSDNGTVTNCYFVNAPDGATSSKGTQVTVYDISLGDGVTMSGNFRTAGRTAANTYHFGRENDAITLSNTATAAPQGYQYGYTASAGTLSGSTLTMPDENVTISVNTAVLLSTRQPVTVAYINADGTTGEASAIALDGTETSLAAGWYFVGKDIDYTATLTLGGDVHLILADGKTMNVGTTGDDHEDYCINAPDGQSLHIYGQAEGTGALNAQTQGDAKGVIHIEGGTLGIHGGNVTATVGGTPDYLLAICVYRTTVGDALVIDRGTLTANGKNGDGIYIEGGDAHINGGQVAATGASAGITVLDALVDESTTIPGILTLSGGTLTASGFDTYSGESYAGTLAVAAGHTYTDGTSLYDSTTETATLAALGGKTLRPCLALADAADNSSLITAANGRTLNVTLQGRTLQAGSWNTFAVPFSMAIPNGWTVKELTGASDDGSTLTLTFGDAASIEAGKPYLVEVASAVANPTFNDVTVSSTPAPSVFDNVISFVPTFGLTALPEGKDNILFLATGNTLKHPSAEGQNLKGFRAYFQLPGGANQARTFRLDLGDNVTGVTLIDNGQLTIDNYAGAGATYNLSGQKVSNDYKGIVIKNGKKIVVH